ncbi:nucleotide exchange factor GrpE [Nonomuraea gerenzanensis]|uniref:Protein GrpE n=1 Tax=Nonomuraea gerenzanensis TaxID=93944 RepID=A0A1M4DY80_9ACTN|nr:nucleotide exchange factor GrpE [Nonomuraea gerenzanensis]UBU13850.1 nucleotide exchange factor GrpE [Nonomuraea gerenzanensis]SBO91527.1 Heat shock protein GrpE [Nonomuraea gerenzanensis]
MPPRDNGHEEPVIRDNRKIDPETGQVRESVPADLQEGAEQAPAPAAGNGELEAQLAERTADLQRLQAEYVNYRRRVERDRAAVREQAVAGALTELLPVLDDIGRARDHGELTGGFAKVAESLESALTKLGLSAFGQKGEPFDPTVHEALMHSYSPDVTEPTAVEVLQPGYRMGDRVLRPARVAVAEPEDAPAASDDDEN